MLTFVKNGRAVSGAFVYCQGGTGRQEAGSTRGGSEDLETTGPTPSILGRFMTLLVLRRAQIFEGCQCVWWNLTATFSFCIRPCTELLTNLQTCAEFDFLVEYFTSHSILSVLSIVDISFAISPTCPSQLIPKYCPP